MRSGIATEDCRAGRVFCAIDALVVGPAEEWRAGGCTVADVVMEERLSLARSLLEETRRHWAGGRR